MGWIDDFVTFSKGNLDERVLEALWSRGVSQDQIELFELGYVDSNLPDLDFPSDFREQFENGSKLADSYVLPLTNFLGEVLGFQFRSVDRASKRYSDYFVTEAEPVLFGLGQSMPHIWSSRSVCIVEGAFDMFPVQRVFPFTISTITAKVREDLLRWLIRLVRKLYLFYDADSSGRRAGSTFVEESGSEFELVQLLEYPRGVKVPGTNKLVKDPADLWEAWGDDKLGPYLRGQIQE
jgi:DNA primase